MSGCSPSTDVTHDMRSCNPTCSTCTSKPWPGMTERDSLVHLRLQAIKITVWAFIHRLSLTGKLSHQAAGWGTQQTLTGGPGCRGKSGGDPPAQEEEFSDRCSTLTSSSCGQCYSPSHWCVTGHLWRLYDTVFTIVFVLLLNNFVWSSLATPNKP